MDNGVRLEVWTTDAFQGLFMDNGCVFGFLCGQRMRKVLLMPLTMSFFRKSERPLL
jgi:hypothetical protein